MNVEKDVYKFVIIKVDWSIKIYILKMDGLDDDLMLNNIVFNKKPQQ